MGIVELNIPEQWSRDLVVEFLQFIKNREIIIVLLLLRSEALFFFFKTGEGRVSRRRERESDYVKQAPCPARNLTRGSIS